jgi:hypothetical protein
MALLRGRKYRDSDGDGCVTAFFIFFIINLAMVAAVIIAGLFGIRL